MDRRNFLKTTGALGIGAMIPFSSPKGEEKDKMIHWGKKTLACGEAPYTPYIQSNQIDNIQWKCVSDVAIHKADKLDPPAFLGTFKKDARWNTVPWNDNKRFKRGFISPMAAEELKLPFWRSADITQTRTPALRIEYDDNKVKKSESIIHYESTVHFQSNYYDSCFYMSLDSLSSFKDMPTFDLYSANLTRPDYVEWKVDTWNERFEMLWLFFMGEVEKRGKLSIVHVHPSFADFFKGYGFKPCSQPGVHLGWRQYGTAKNGLPKYFVLWGDKDLDPYELIFKCISLDHQKLSKFRIRFDET